MAKTQEETKRQKNAKSKDGKESKEVKDPKGPKGKDSKVLMKRVKKAIKRSRQKLSEEKFEKELQRTIVFLEELQQRIHPQPGSEPAIAVEPNQSVVKKSKSKSGNGKAREKNSVVKEVTIPAVPQAGQGITGK